VTYQQLLDKVRESEGVVFQTVTGKEFRVGIYMDCPFFIPISTGQGRSDGRLAVQRFLERFNATGSRKTTDYKDVTQNTSYLIPLLDRWTDL